MGAGRSLNAVLGGEGARGGTVVRRWNVGATCDGPSAISGCWMVLFMMHVTVRGAVGTVCVVAIGACVTCWMWMQGRAGGSDSTARLNHVQGCCRCRSIARCGWEAGLGQRLGTGAELPAARQARPGQAWLGDGC